MDSPNLPMPSAEYVCLGVRCRGYAQRSAIVEFQDALPELPDGIGLAGAIAGKHGPYLLIAGGANFPDEPRWETSKAWHDRIQVLDLNTPEKGWLELSSRLPRATAYGVSLTHPTFGVVIRWRSKWEGASR